MKPNTAFFSHPGRVAVLVDCDDTLLRKRARSRPAVAESRVE